jgi:hypothetical protein
MTKAYFKDAVGVLMVYNVYDRASFDNLQKTWIPQVRAFAQANVPLILVANKVDDASAASPRVVSMEDGLALAKEHGCNYLEVSAQMNTNVDVAFRRIIFSVAGVLTDIRKSLAADGLPLGWLSLGEADDGGEEYCNYWTGETTSDEPDEPAPVHVSGRENDNFVKLEMSFRDSFWYVKNQ